MQKSNAPTKLTVAFASGTGAGPVNNVPLTPGATPGTASYQTGFTSVNMEPIASGGIPPFGADFNGLHQASTTAQIWQQSGYIYGFDSSFASNANINGYPQNALLARADGNGYWLNLVDGNTTNPDTGGANWAAVRANIGMSTIAVTAGNNTPTANQLASGVLNITGSLASAAALILPLVAGGSWIVLNSTTGAGTLTVSGSSGAGVTVPQNTALKVFTGGANFYAVAAPISGAYLPIDGTAVAATKLATARNFSITGLATAAAISFDGTGNVVFNVTALNVAGALGYTPANDASVVHIAGTESITGNKTFTGVAPISSGAQAGWQFNDRASGSGWTWYATGGIARLFSTFLGADVASISSTGAWSFTANVSASHFTSSDNMGFVLPSGWFLTSATGVNFGVWNGGAWSLKLDGSSNATFLGSVTCAALNATTGTFSGAVTCTTMNATSSDRRLKRNIRKVAARPLHRSVKFVSYTMKDSGWCGLGSIAQNVKRYAPEHVGTFEKDGKTYFSLNYAGMAYEQAIWDGQEIDRLTKRIAKLERALDRARIEPRKRGFVRRLLEAIW